MQSGHESSTGPQAMISRVVSGRLAWAVGLASGLLAVALLALVLDVHWAVMAGVGGAIVAAATAVHEVRRSVLIPVRALTDAAQQMIDGDLSARVKLPAGHQGFGRLAHAFNELGDTVERQRVEMAAALGQAAERESIMRSILDAAPDAISLFDPAGKLVVENGAAHALRESLGTRLVTALQGEAPTDDGIALDEVEPAGTDRIFIRFRTPVMQTGHKGLGRLVTMREITAERESERAKEEFFTLVSHELRTPLTSIVGYLDLLIREGEGDAPLSEERRREFTVVIDRNAKRLLRLVGDLLFVAKMDSETMTLERREYDLGAVARESIEAARLRAAERDITLSADVDEAPPLSGDADRIAQSIDNLISNALTFTPEGGHVEVRVRAGEEGALLEVADDGIGIAPKEQDQLFERFFRATSATTHALPGIGLGLTIVKAIVEQHGGKISVSSVLGKGTTFSVRLPASRPAGQQAPSVVRPLGKGGRRRPREASAARPSP